jgi:hypothetical protein
LGRTVPASSSERKVVGRVEGETITATITGPTEWSILGGRFQWQINHTIRPIFKGRVVPEGTGSCLEGEVADRAYVSVIQVAYFASLMVIFLPLTVLAAVSRLSQDPAVMLMPFSVLVFAAPGAVVFRTLRQLGDLDAADLQAVLSAAIASGPPDASNAQRRETWH